MYTVDDFKQDRRIATMEFISHHIILSLAAEQDNATPLDGDDRLNGEALRQILIESYINLFCPDLAPTDLEGSFFIVDQAKEVYGDLISKYQRYAKLKGM